MTEVLGVVIIRFWAVAGGSSGLWPFSVSR